MSYDISLLSKNINTKPFDEKGYASMYGELTFEGFYEMFKNFSTADLLDRVFYDLGSGAGIVLKHAVLYPFKRVIGIELSKERYLYSLKIYNQIDLFNVNKLTILKNDILNKKINYSDADYIYISNFSNDPEINKKIGEKLNNECKKGCVIFSSKSICCGDIKLVRIIYVKQTWCNKSKLHVQIKKMI